MPTELTVEVLAAPVVNHAMAHNGLPFLHRLVVSSPAPLADVLITARVVDAFGTVLSRPWQHPVERVEAGHPLVVDQPALRLDPAYLSGVEEETGAEIVVEVTVAGEPAGGTTHPIRVQAARQWTLDPAAPVLSLELLAAFVQPNHPALPALISEAAQILATVTGSGSLAVSHATPERIDEIVGAVFTAVHDREIFYASAAGQLGLRPEGPHIPATCSPTGSEPAWTPRCCSPRPWSTSASPRCSGSRTGTPSWATGASRSGGCPTRPAPRSRCRRTRWTWS